MNIETKVYIVVGGASLISFAIGGASGYFLTKAKYEKIAEQEIAEAKVFYSRLNKKGEFADPTNLAQTYQSLVKDYSGDSGPHVVTTDSIMDIEESILDIVELDEDFNYIEEVKNRTEDEPYVISHDEFYQGEKDYAQVSLTYFEEDDILCDEKDTPVPDTEATVGDENLKRFGHGSNDNNIVYIRNDRIEIDFEVVKSKGNYAKEVLGFIEHSEHVGRPRRFRRDHE